MHPCSWTHMILTSHISFQTHHSSFSPSTDKEYEEIQCKLHNTVLTILQWLWAQPVDANWLTVDTN